MNVIISCSGKFHAFALAEQMHRVNQLKSFYTLYASSKNKFLKEFVKRIDKEVIPSEAIITNTLLAIPAKLIPSKAFYWNDLFDRWVASQLEPVKDGVFIGWSGMSLRSIKRAKALGMKTILERGSAHIEYQNDILREEYKRFGINFSIDPKVIDKELSEYELVDFISLPSTFAKNSFLRAGISNNKIYQNPYGASQSFTRAQVELNDKFTILYVGGLTVQKGVKYLLEAIEKLDIPEESFQVWFIGHISVEIKVIIKKIKRFNIKYFGHINHYDLPNYISRCHVAVQPSLQDGFGMVINQTLACGVPTIATVNTGGPDIIKKGQNGFIVSIRSSDEISKWIKYLYDNPLIRMRMSSEAAKLSLNGFSWNEYGNRYNNFIENINGAK